MVDKKRSEAAKKGWQKFSKEERTKRTANGTNASVEQQTTQKYWNAASDDEKKQRMKVARDSLHITHEQSVENGRKGGNANIERLKRSQSEIMRNYWANLTDEERAARKVHLHTEETKKKMGKTQNIVNKDPSVKARKSASQKAAWAKLTPEERHRRTVQGNIVRLQRNVNTSSTSIEIAICRVLDSYGIHYETQKWIGRWCVDIYIHSKKLIINCDGDYWHSFPNRIQNDRELDEWCDKYHYMIAHVTETEIRKNPEQALMDALRKMKKYDK